VLPLQLFAIATDIVPERYLDAGAWREMPLRTDRARKLTFRLTPDNRILVRGGVRYHPFGRYGEKVPRAPIRALTDSLHRHDPALRAVDCAYQWTGLLGRTRTGRPLMGRAGRDGRILYAIGFNGFGLVDGFEAGRRLALRTVAPGRDAGFAADPPRWKTVYPPEPLRYLIVNAILALRAWR
jgi:glycine/D-amino acid oxidase-like deaminating enzyme